ncbi:hypothetical protein DSM104443_01556 [Usitatibacter rugosus]|uniref:GmrSD restriction endonucleases N-terminal domain-containing protein n=1 Tax=Usitatibacter rugosus TaxID=2732067 RepID=A0A6M4GTZ9_9PROT|nr:DUF262 domain-containing protein [Usitatibacter rugosus]QJR10492.1 hypothetical protein DSM104443_01556 [Usitatibacter rugosus]
MSFGITDLRNSTVWQLYRMREQIQIDPEYQRLGDIWAPDNRQLLVDTILNGFDVPKIYLHKFPKPILKGGKTYEFAIVDGRQRLETMWAFIEGRITLDDEFKYFKEPKVLAGGMTYEELGQSYPDLKSDYDGFVLSVVLIETDDLEMIEEMFSRLNEAAPLTAAEKRNALGGPMPIAIKKLSKTSLFTKKLPFPNKRYRHFDLAAKFLLTERERKVVDTKKTQLDEFVEEYKAKPRNKLPTFVKTASETAAGMSKVFGDNDPLLRQLGMVMVYYHLFRVARDNKWSASVTRKKLVDFNRMRDENRAAVEQGNKKVDLDLVQFERYAQSPNDSAAIKFRLQLLAKRAFGRTLKLGEL